MFIPDPNFSIPDFDPLRRIKAFLTQKMSLSYRKYDLGCLSQIRIFFYPGSLIRIFFYLESRIRVPESSGPKTLNPGSGSAILQESASQCTTIAAFRKLHCRSQDFDYDPGQAFHPFSRSKRYGTDLDTGTRRESG
jgi:hypothetical protein